MHIQGQTIFWSIVAQILLVSAFRYGSANSLWCWSSALPCVSYQLTSSVHVYANVCS